MPSPSPSKARAAQKGASPVKKNIQIITRDHIRTLQPHGTSPTHSIGPIVLGTDDINRIKGEAEGMTEEQRTQRKRDQVNAQTLALETAKQRKLRMSEADASRNAASSLSETAELRKEANNHLLAKAQMQLDEELDDIKRLNEMILEAKCMAIRDGQLVEKKELQSAAVARERGLDEMMEADRVKDIARVAERDLRRKADRREGAAIIRKQIEDREEMNLLEQEKKEQETRMMLNQISATQEKDIQEKKARHAQQHIMMDQVSAANAQSIERKRAQKLADQQSDREAMQYLVDQAKRQEEKEVEAVKRKAEREEELGRLRAQQQRAVDKQAIQDALRQQRAFEAAERDWRKKEIDTATRGAENERRLKEERTRQQADREHATAVEAAKIRENFNAALARNQAEEAKLLQDQLRRHNDSTQYAREVQAQIEQKEVMKRNARSEFFAEGVRLEQGRREKEGHVRDVKERKLQELVDAGVPDQYTAEVRRRMNEGERRENARPGGLTAPFATLAISQFDKPVTHTRS